MSTTLTVYGSTSDGYFFSTTDGHFSLARDAASAWFLSAAGTTLRIGLGYINPPLPGDKYRFYRAGLYFDTSAIPSAAAIVSATLSLYLVGNLDIIPVGFEAVLAKMKDNDETYPHDPLEVGDFDRTLYVTGGASSPTVYNGSSGFLTFTFNATGKAGWINKDGTSKFLVMSSLDIGYSLPNLYMIADFYTREQGTSYAPKLVVTYAIPCTVTTGAATGITSSGATGHGQMTDAGGESITEYGVIWNTDGSDPVNKASADHYATGSDIDGSGNFTGAITGCASGTAYYYRAYATTIAGTSVGVAVQFTTSTVSALTVTTGDPSSVAAETATLNGTITDDGGYSITEHGFIYKVGGDPGEPVDPTTAEAYTQEGAGAVGAFHSDLAGLTEGTTYYVRAYVQSTDDGGHLAYGGLAIVRTGTEVEETVYGLAGDGQVQRNDSGSTPAVWAANASASTGIAAPTDLEYLDLYVYDYYTEFAYYSIIKRGYVYFDVAAVLPEGAVLTAATLYLYVESRNDLPDEDRYCSPLYVSNGMPTYPTDAGGVPALALGDYANAYFSTIAQIARDDIVVGAYNGFTLLPGHVTASGLTKFRLTQTNNAGSDYAPIRYRVTSADAATNKPKLVVTYVVSAVPPITPKANIADAWVDPETALVNIGDEWVEPEETKINIGDAWVDPQ